MKKNEKKMFICFVDATTKTILDSNLSMEQKMDLLEAIDTQYIKNFRLAFPKRIYEKNNTHRNNPMDTTIPMGAVANTQ